MKQIYRTTINGRVLESDSLHELLARAVVEKLALSRKMKVASSLRDERSLESRAISALPRAVDSQEQDENQEPKAG